MNTATDLIIATLAVVILYNLLRFAETTKLQGAAGAFQAALNHILDPARPLVPWAPGTGP